MNGHPYRHRHRKVVRSTTSDVSVYSSGHLPRPPGPSSDPSLSAIAVFRLTLKTPGHRKPLLHVSGQLGHPSRTTEDPLGSPRSPVLRWSTGRPVPHGRLVWGTGGRGTGNTPDLGGNLSPSTTGVQTDRDGTPPSLRSWSVGMLSQTTGS